MAARRRTNISEQDSDYDGAWKEVLRQHLREILEKYLPAIAVAIDWRQLPQWSDKELGRILRQRRRRPKSVDTLVKVRLLNGAEQWILLHLEIQSSREAHFEFRIFHTTAAWSGSTGSGSSRPSSWQTSTNHGAPKRTSSGWGASRADCGSRSAS